MQCECCGKPGAVTAIGSHFACKCMGAVLCKTCNRCVDHCLCEGGVDPEMPYPVQVAEICLWWMRQGLAAR